MRSGCLRFALLLGAAAVSAFLVAAGVILLLVGVASLDSWSASTLIAVLVIPFGVYFFVLVGRSVWQDLKDAPKDPNKEAKDESES